MDEVNNIKRRLIRLESIEKKVMPNLQIPQSMRKLFNENKEAVKDIVNKPARA
jgi:hypothetical protein